VPGLPQSLEDCRRVRHRAGQHLTDCFVSWILGKRRAAVSNKPFRLKHQDLHRRESEERHWGAEYSDLMSQKTAPVASLQRAVCPLWVKSRHMRCTKPCPLYPRKRTFVSSLRAIGLVAVWISFRACHQHINSAHLRALLRAGRERVCSSRTSKKRDELRRLTRSPRRRGQPQTAES
jgi:hypothetical protein